MSCDRDLENLYRSYLESMLDPQVGKELSQALHRVGLHAEGQALKIYFAYGPESTCIFQQSYWYGRRCFVGAYLPAKAKPGDLWFDIVELTPMILVPDVDTTSHTLWRWISTHPAYVWQFRTFLRLVDWHLVRTYFMNAPDLMMLDRFEFMSSMAFVNNVYHEESVAYAHWFGKFLCGQFDFQAAKKFLKPEEFSEMLPKNLRVWDEVQYSNSEFVRIAVGQDTLDKDPDNEFELREAGENELLPDRMLFEEWEHNFKIGLSTFVLLQAGLIERIPRKGYEFLELQNAAPRLEREVV